MISERISDDIAPQMKILNFGYPHSNAPITFPLQKPVKMYFVAPIRPATPAA